MLRPGWRQAEHWVPCSLARTMCPSTRDHFYCESSPPWAAAVCPCTPGVRGKQHCSVSASLSLWHKGTGELWRDAEPLGKLKCTPSWWYWSKKWGGQLVSEISFFSWAAPQSNTCCADYIQQSSARNASSYWASLVSVGWVEVEEAIWNRNWKKFKTPITLQKLNLSPSQQPKDQMSPDDEKRKIPNSYWQREKAIIYCLPTRMS